MLHNTDPISAFGAHTTTTFDGLPRFGFCYLTPYNTTQYSTTFKTGPSQTLAPHEHWQHACKDGDTAVTRHLDEASPYLVFTEGVLDLAGGLVQFSLFGVGQGQLGQVALFLAVGSVEEGRPFGRLEAEFADGTFEVWLSVHGTQTGRGSQGLVKQEPEEPNQWVS